MSLGEDEAETEVSVNTEVPSCGRWNSGKLLSPGQEPEHLEIQGGPLWRTEADPGCISGVFLSQTHSASKEPVADRSKPPLSGPLPSASVGTGELLHSMGSQVSRRELRLEPSWGCCWGVHFPDSYPRPRHCKVGAV